MSFLKQYFIHISAFFLLLFTFSYWFYLMFIPKHDTLFYIAQVKAKESNYENKYSELSLDLNEVKRLEKCSKNNECFRNFYEQYTLKYGAKKAMEHLYIFSHMENSKYLSECHQGAHGIGYGELKNNSIAKALSILGDKAHFTDDSCLGGYIHGIVEVYLRGTTEKSKVIQKFKEICSIKDEGGYLQNNCFHGVGHTLLMQFDYDLNISLEFCDAVTSVLADQYDCYTGVIMEYRLLFPEEIYEGWKSDFLKPIFSSTFCDGLVEKYRTACYMELGRYFRINAQNSKNYQEIISSCGKIANPLYRLTCIKYNARFAFSFAYYSDVAKMCQTSTQNRSERITCTATYAYFLGTALYPDTNSTGYRGLISDVCKTLNVFESGKCFQYLKNHQLSISFTQASDLTRF